MSHFLNTTISFFVYIKHEHEGIRILFWVFCATQLFMENYCTILYTVHPLKAEQHNMVQRFWTFYVRMVQKTLVCFRCLFSYFNRFFWSKLSIRRKIRSLNICVLWSYHTSNSDAFHFMKNLNSQEKKSITILENEGFWMFMRPKFELQPVRNKWKRRTFHIWCVDQGSHNLNCLSMGKVPLKV